MGIRPTAVEIRVAASELVAGMLGLRHAALARAVMGLQVRRWWQGQRRRKRRCVRLRRGRGQLVRAAADVWRR